MKAIMPSFDIFMKSFQIGIRQLQQVAYSIDVNMAIDESSFYLKREHRSQALNPKWIKYKNFSCLFDSPCKCSKKARNRYWNSYCKKTRENGGVKSSRMHSSRNLFDSNDTISDETLIYNVSRNRNRKKTYNGECCSRINSTTDHVVPRRGHRKSKSLPETSRMETCNAKSLGQRNCGDETIDSSTSAISAVIRRLRLKTTHSVSSNCSNEGSSSTDVPNSETSSERSYFSSDIIDQESEDKSPWQEQIQCFYKTNDKKELKKRKKALLKLEDTILNRKSQGSENENSWTAKLFFNVTDKEMKREIVTAALKLRAAKEERERQR